MLVAPRSQGLLDEMTKDIGPIVDTEALEDMEDVVVEQADEPMPAVVVQEHSKQRKYRQKPPSGIQYMLHWLIPESLRNQDSFMHPIPNGTVAVFNQDCDISDLPQPSICHYMYAGAILKAFASKEHSSAVQELDHDFFRAYSLQEIEEEWRKQRTVKRKVDDELDTSRRCSFDSDEVQQLQEFFGFFQQKRAAAQRMSFVDNWRRNQV